MENWIIRSPRIQLYVKGVNKFRSFKLRLIDKWYNIEKNLIFS